jgi:hypothetical protein
MFSFSVLCMVEEAEDRIRHTCIHICLPSSLVIPYLLHNVQYPPPLPSDFSSLTLCLVCKSGLCEGEGRGKSMMIRCWGIWCWANHHQSILSYSVRHTQVWSHCATRSPSRGANQNGTFRCVCFFESFKQKITLKVMKVGMDEWMIICQRFSFSAHQRTYNILALPWQSKKTEYLQLR